VIRLRKENHICVIFGSCMMSLNNVDFNKSRQKLIFFNFLISLKSDF